MKLDIDRLKVLNRELRGAMATITKRAADQKRDIEKLAGIVAETQYVITREFELE
jgi:uncharacterized coiled-coil protein SlyX